MRIIKCVHNFELSNVMGKGNIIYNKKKYYNISEFRVTYKLFFDFLKLNI